MQVLSKEPCHRRRQHLSPKRARVTNLHCDTTGIVWVHPLPSRPLNKPLPLFTNTSSGQCFCNSGPFLMHLLTCTACGTPRCMDCVTDRIRGWSGWEHILWRLIELSCQEGPSLRAPLSSWRWIIFAAIFQPQFSRGTEDDIEHLYTSIQYYSKGSEEHVRMRCHPPPLVDKSVEGGRARGSTSMPARRRRTTKLLTGIGSKG